MQSIASSATRTGFGIAVAVLSACALIPQTRSASAVVALVFVSIALIVTVLELAYIAGREIPVDVGDYVRLDNGVHGRVRSVRWGYTVVDTELATVLVPNHRLQHRRPVGRL